MRGCAPATLLVLPRGGGTQPLSRCATRAADCGVRKCARLQADAHGRELPPCSVKLPDAGARPVTCWTLIPAECVTLLRNSCKRDRQIWIGMNWPPFRPDTSA